MAHWLLKSEPDEYSWDDLVHEGEAMWNGVRNHQAANNMRAMTVGDNAFFYHSGASAGKMGPHIVGICTISQAASPDPADDSGKWVVVHVKPLEKLPRSVPLKLLKSETNLSDLAILKQSRLSVAPIKAEEWEAIMHLAHRTN